MVKFVGKVRHAVDAKGRLMIPSKYRAIIGEQTLYILPGESGNLTVYTEESFDRLADRIDEKLENAEDLTAEDEADIRSWIASADYVNLDPQGRILIGQEHRALAGLGKEAIINGALDHFEVWSPENWEKVQGPETEERQERTRATMRKLRIRA